MSVTKAKATQAVLDAVQRRDGDTCRYCSIAVDWEHRREPNGGTFDHVDPYGDSTFENLAVCCLSCNRRKGRRTPEEWTAAIRAQRPSTSDLRTVAIKIPTDVWEQLHRLAYENLTSKQALVIEAIATAYGPPSAAGKSRRSKVAG